MEKIRRLLLIVVALCAFQGTSHALNVPQLKARVNDYANLLSPIERDGLESMLQKLENKTSTQVVILTVGSLQGEEIKAFSLKVAETWKLGQKGMDNGLLITYSTEGDHFRLEVGYGLEGAIPDGLAGDILRDQFRAHAPKNGSKNFNQAFVATVQRISQIVEAEYAKDPSGASMRKKDMTGVVITIIIGLIVTFVVAAFGYAAAGTSGGICGGVLALVMSGGLGLFLLFIILGIVAGMLIRLIGEAGGGGGSGGWASSSGSSDSSFSGGGGGFGGGGASD